MNQVGDPLPPPPPKKGFTDKSRPATSMKQKPCAYTQGMYVCLYMANTAQLPCEDHAVTTAGHFGFFTKTNFKEAKKTASASDDK